MTDPTTTPCPGPCAAVRSKDPAVYGVAPAPDAAEAECLDRMMRAGPPRSPPTSSSACSGCASTPPRSPPPGGCAGEAVR